MAELLSSEMTVTWSGNSESRRRAGGKGRDPRHTCLFESEASTVLTRWSSNRTVGCHASTVCRGLVMLTSTLSSHVNPSTLGVAATLCTGD